MGGWEPEGLEAIFNSEIRVPLGIGGGGGVEKMNDVVTWCMT